MKHTIAKLSNLALCGYFFIFGLIFITMPNMAAELGVTHLNPAGVTEIRAYYGAVSIALSGFFFTLFLKGQYQTSLLGGLILCACVVTTRITGSVIDQAFNEAYTLFAIPAELGMLCALCAAYWCARTAQEHTEISI